MQRSVALALSAVLIAFAAACGDPAGVTAPSGPAATNPVDDQIASGSLKIRYIFGTNVVDNYIFNAVKDDSGHVTGQFAMFQSRFFFGFRKQSRAQVSILGRIVCLEVVGHEARIGGFVTESNFRFGIPVGAPITFSVSDNSGTTKPDRASPLLGGVDPYAYCSNGLPYPEHSVGSGDVTVIEDDGR